MIWLTIILMTVIIFISRYIFIEPKLPLRLSAGMVKFLSYSAPAVLTAILAPIVFLQDNTLHLNLDNSYLIGAVFAVLLILLTRNTLLTAVLSMLLFFLVH
ncbi:AzlD domain-containing protein [Moritella sp. F3]|uniref:AzlD domain-containing protein n=1 Tax=Moritella sp. F3 TaxID=2718882 RepID=UPI0018E0F043|nr:AzlD domain-containing protein [Moritella sp. F3]GIC78719.1 branched-chain amino acid ABC transporter [Moritella sp. F1]GIC82679.1 branched-chain amino acid ABC transporter [Moritella sp. F3]